MGWETLGSLRSKVRVYVRDPVDSGDTQETTAQWTREALNQFLNDGLRDFAHRTLYFEERATRFVTPNEQVYPYPDDTIGYTFTMVEFQQSSGVRYPLDYEKIALLRRWGKKDKGFPRYFSVYRRCIWLWPIPGGSATASVELPIRAENGIVFIEFPNEERLQLATISELDYPWEIPLETVGGYTGITLPNGDFLPIVKGSGSVVELSGKDVVIRVDNGDPALLAKTDAFYGAILVYYAKDPEPMVEDTDGCELEDVLTPALVHYAVRMCLTQIGDPAWRFHHDEYERLVRQATVMRRRKQRVRPNRMHTPHEYGWRRW
jgi:hypothetical protein